MIPAALVTLFVGMGIGSAAGGGEGKSSNDAKPRPTVTVTQKAAEKAAKTAPRPTVTVTKTAKPKPAKPEAADDSKSGDDTADKAPSGKVVFKVWGSAPAGADVTYGSDSDNREGSGLPMTKTLNLDTDALYYHVSAQLQGGGDINCSVTVNGTTKKGHASGGYNICSAQLNGGLTGGWD